MTQRVLFAFLMLAVAVASAKTYTVNFNHPVTVAGKELQAGGYKVDLTGDKVVITNGKMSVESAVKVEQGEKKFLATSVQFSNGTDGKMLVHEIDLGGTKTKLLFD